MRKAAVFVPPRRSPLRLRLLVWAALWLFGGVGLLLFALGLRAPAVWPPSTVFQWAPDRTADDERPAFVWPPEMSAEECAAYLRPVPDVFALLRRRVAVEDPPAEAALPMDCAAIRRRAHFQTAALDNAPCPTRWRHTQCILGAEHLPELLAAPQLFANKFLPAFDFGAAVCWLEELHRRTHLDRGLHRLRSDFYLERPQVRFNRERWRWGHRFNVSLFDYATLENLPISVKGLHRLLPLANAETGEDYGLLLLSYAEGRKTWKVYRYLLNTVDSLQLLAMDAFCKPHINVKGDLNFHTFLNETTPGKKIFLSMYPNMTSFESL
ncbi:hypothetical protein M3Y99_01582200 [Aphelenchoides fujianensis]|nr:hypothetical protein M3Y99_01582200 [Aphelenchoides fujianensis]